MSTKDTSRTGAGVRKIAAAQIPATPLAATNIYGQTVDADPAMAFWDAVFHAALSRGVNDPMGAIDANGVRLSFDQVVTNAGLAANNALGLRDDMRGRRGSS